MFKFRVNKFRFLNLEEQIDRNRDLIFNDQDEISLGKKLGQGFNRFEKDEEEQ